MLLLQTVHGRSVAFGIQGSNKSWVFFHRKQFEKNFYYGPIKKEMIHTLMNRHFMCKGEEESVENTRVSNYELMSLS